MQITESIRKALAGLAAFQKVLETSFVEREDEVQQLILALLTKEHIFWHGKPGRAKTMLPRAAFDMITGSNTFVIQLTKYMSDDHLFGPVSISKMRKDDVIVHNTKDTIVDAHFAVLDEFFDANDATRRSVLSILNEREFIRGVQRQKSPLHTAVLTSNYWEDNESMEAVLDRLMFRSEIQNVTSQENRLAMYHTALKQSKHKQHIVDLQEIEMLCEAREEVVIQDKALELFDEIVHEYADKAGKDVSDRRAVKLLKLLQASALLRGSNEVDIDEDAPMLKMGLCRLNTPETATFDGILSQKVSLVRITKEGAVQLDVLTKKLEGFARKFSRIDPDTDEQKIKDLREAVSTFVTVLAQRQKPPVTIPDQEQRFDMLLRDARGLLGEYDKYLSGSVKVKGGRNSASALVS